MDLMLTQHSGAIVGPIAKLFGMIMNGIYEFFNNFFHIESIGISIIIFTILVKVLLLPLVIKQQRSMKDLQKLQPELKKLQEKYKNKKDPESQKKYQQEMAKIYQDNNVSPLGGCLPLLVQFPIMIALFSVLRNLPAYISHIKEVYLSLVVKVSTESNFTTAITEFEKTNGKLIKNFNVEDKNKVIDLLYTFNSAQWAKFKETFSAVGNQIEPIISKIQEMNYFLGINLSDSPISSLNDIFTVAALIPILCFLSQLIITKLTPTSSSGDPNQEASQKTMMYLMPVISLIFVITMPAGLGLYWLTGNIFTIFQQLFLNKIILKEDK